MGFGGSGEGEVGDEFLERVADEAGEEGGPDGADGEALEGVGCGEVGALPLVPEVDDDREHGAGVQHDEDEGHGGGGGVEVEEFFGDDDVRGAGDGEEFGEALDDGQDDDLQERHGEIVKAGSRE